MLQDELDLKILAVLNDIEKSSTNFIDDACKSVVSHIRAVELLSDLGQVFALSLNFQTLMWQLVLMESIFPVNMNREHLQRESSVLHIFAKLLPEVGPCAVPPPPLPPAPAAQASVSMLASTTSNPDKGAAIANPDNPPDESHHVPLPQTLGVIQTPSVSAVTPKVSTPQVLTPQMPAAQASMPQMPAAQASMPQMPAAQASMPQTSMQEVLVPNFLTSDAAEHVRVAVHSLLGLKGPADGGGLQQRSYRW